MAAAAASRWPAVVKALVDLLYARPGYRAAGDDAGNQDDVLVLDGPEVELTADLADRFILIGSTLDVDGDDQGETSQTLATVSAGQNFDETGTVVCQAVAQTGSLELAHPGVLTADRTTMRWLTARAFAIFDDVIDITKATPGLGIDAPRIHVQRRGRVIPRRYQTDTGGAVVTVEFTIGYDTRL
jgi:hypothetical protein